jgi:hypothetical protein
MLSVRLVRVEPRRVPVLLVLLVLQALLQVLQVQLAAVLR